MRSLLGALLLICALAWAGCGSGEEKAANPGEPVENVRPEVRPEVEAAQNPQASDFPDPKGRSLQQLANEVGGAGPQVGLGGSVFTTGGTRVPFGVISQETGFIYGPTAVYVARGPNAPAKGPYLAPADVLVTDPAYRSKQAATESDPFAAVYAAEVPFDKPGEYAIFTVTRLPDDTFATAGTQLDVIAPSKDEVPAVGDKAPKVETDTLKSVGGDEALLDTRQPSSDMHGTSFDEVVGRKPVLLLFATPQLCQSRVCGPVVDVALQLRDTYGDRMEFIHQEVFVDNDLQKGLRDPLKAFNLPTEPWLFAVDADGVITTRLEGSFGLRAVEEAIKSAL